jgi:beta-glucosidase
MKTCLTTKEIKNFDNIIIQKISKGSNILLPKDFLFGVATASYQNEGETMCNWTIYENKYNLDKNLGVGSWKYFENDVKLMKHLGINSYRMSLEWSRIIPKPNIIDNNALEKYLGQIKLLKKNNIEPLVTLHHFTRPIWLDNTYEGLHNDEVIQHFLFYVKIVADYFNNYVFMWNTFNEPMLELLNGYIKGVRPPEFTNDFKNFEKGLINICKMHSQAYHILHKVNNNNKVSIAKNFILINNDYYDLLKSYASRSFDYIYNYSILDALTTGKLEINLNFMVYNISIKYYNEKMKNTIDYVGVNHYNIMYPIFNYFPVKADIVLTTEFSGYETNHMRWDVCPSSLYIVLKALYKRYNLPIYITENGCCDNTYQRPLAIKTMKYFMNGMKMAIDEGVDVKGYHCWTLIDNYEWEDGYLAKFGLYYLNVYKLKEQIKNNEKEDKSKIITNYGKFYREIIKFNRTYYE